MKKLINNLIDKQQKPKIEKSKFVIKVKHNSEMKRFTQKSSDLDFDKFKYKILVAFNYIQDLECKFDPNQSLYESQYLSASAVHHRIDFENVDESGQEILFNSNALVGYPEVQDSLSSQQLSSDKAKKLEAYEIDLICSNHESSDLLLISDQQTFNSISQSCIKKQTSLQITALISFNLNKIQEGASSLSKSQNLLVDKLKNHQVLKQSDFSGNSANFDPVGSEMPENKITSVKVEEVSNIFVDEDFVMLGEAGQDDLESVTPPHVPLKMGKSASIAQGQEFEHIHPRMIYEIMKYISQNGKIDASQIHDILVKFEDVNVAENKCSKEQESKYMNFALEAVVETVSRHKVGRYGDYQEGNEKTLHLSSSIEFPSITDPSLLKPTQSVSEIPALTRLQQVKANLKASKMEREKNEEIIPQQQEDSILDKIELKESIYDEESYRPPSKIEEKKLENNKSSIETEQTTGISDKEAYITPYK